MNFYVVIMTSALIAFGFEGNGKAAPPLVQNQVGLEKPMVYSPAEALRLANAAFVMGQYAEAARVLGDSPVLPESPEYPRWRRIFCLSLVMLGQVDTAYRVYSGPEPENTENSELDRDFGSFLRQEMTPEELLRVGSRAVGTGKWFVRVKQTYLESLSQLGKHEEALIGLRALLDLKTIDADQRIALETLERRSRASTFVDMTSIGVLIPVSGPRSHIGEKVLRSLKLALSQGDGSVKLVVEDTRGESTSVKALIERLVFENRVAAIFGPVGAKEAEVASLVARELEVPLVILSSAEIPDSVRSLVVQRRATLFDEVKALFEWASRAGGSKVALLAPANGYGAEVTRAVKKAAPLFGLELYRQVDFEPSETDFRAVAKELAGGKQVHGKRIPFDLLLLPTTARHVIRALPYLRAQGFRFQKSPDTGSGIQLLGTRLWNQPTIVDPAQGNTAGAVFTAVFDKGSEREGVQEFIGAFRQRFALDPTGFEVEAYDAAVMLIRGLRKAQQDATGRAGLIFALSHPARQQGLIGEYPEEGSEEGRRRLLLMTVDGESIQQISP